MSNLGFADCSVNSEGRENPERCKARYEYSNCRRAGFIYDHDHIDFLRIEPGPCSVAPWRSLTSYRVHDFSSTAQLQGEILLKAVGHNVVVGDLFLKRQSSRVELQRKIIVVAPGGTFSWPRLGLGQ